MPFLDTYLVGADQVAGGGCRRAGAGDDGIAPSAALAEQPHGDPGAVFVETNDIYANAILAYARSPDGTLTPAGRYPTAGRGGTEVGVPTDPLSSQGALTYDPRRHLLYAVNPGSDTLSVFAVRGTRLRLLQVIASGGSFPVSVAIHKSLVYVLNAGGDGTISGYRTDDRAIDTNPFVGAIIRSGQRDRPPSSSAHSLRSASPTMARICWSAPRATEPWTRLRSGATASPPPLPSAPRTGPVPFPFVFDVRGRVVLVSASGFANTYRVDQDGALIATGAPAPSGQNAPCWLVEARGYFYVTNTASNTVTGYAEAPDGQLALLRPDGVSATTAAGPIDLEASPDGRYVFELNGLAGDLGVYAVAPDGTLTQTGTVGGLPAFNGSNGMEGIAVS